MGRSLLNRVKTSEFQKGIFDNVMITNIDIKDRKGQNGPINKMIYLKFAQLNDASKKIAESELSWWKMDITSEYFKTNLQEFCFQLHNILATYTDEDKAFDAFSKVFDVIGITDHNEIGNRRWKQTEFNSLITAIKETFLENMTPFINVKDNLIRLKLSTNYKGEDIEIPKYGSFVESMNVENTQLKFSAAELKTHSKAGNMGNTNTITASSSSASI